MEVLKPILYYSIFNHPLNEEEIFRFSSVQNERELKIQLEMLKRKNIISELAGYYFIENGIDQIEKREYGSRAAKLIMPKALDKAKLISKFPFIAGVAFSGSLSKDYYDESSDVDFFIITKTDRLWIARTFLILYKKLFLLNSRKFFCLNYFISEETLEIEEKNRFTATELVTLKVVHGKQIFHKFFNENKWAFDFFNMETPNLSSHSIQNNKPLFTKLLEDILTWSFADKIDNWFRNVTVRKWMRKFSMMEKEEFKIALKSKKNISKHHPQNFQKKVIKLLNEKYDDVLSKHNLKLEKEYA